MPDWFYNSYAPIKSGFLHNLENPPKLIQQGNIRLIEDEYPGLTNCLEDLYKKHVLNDINTKLTNSEKNKFRKSAIMLNDYIERNKHRILPERIKDVGKKAEYLFNCITDGANDDLSRITPGYFCNETMFSTTLSRYSQSQGLFWR
jgi:hypothetical protein